MKRFLAILLAVVMVLGLVACQSTPAADQPEEPAASQQPEEVLDNADQIIEEKEYEKTYKTYFSNSYASFNYYTTAYATVREIVANCIDGLVEPDIYGVYRASLAEDWDVNEDQTVWTFKIR
ncbi:MAG: hypothetical protein IJC67_06170, partial [Clostridia bacterium]|nr:hypothetical protein [Clostridia bacterium]